MDKQVQKTIRRSRRRIGLRKRISGTTERPRLTVYKSLNHMHAQINQRAAARSRFASE